MARSVAVLVGFGNVGKELAALLVKNEYRLNIELAAVAASRGSVIIGGPADRVNLLKLIEKGDKLDKHPMFKPGLGPVETAGIVGADLAFIAIPPSYETGEPNRTLYYSLLDMGVSIITADKTVLALEYDRFMGEARKRGLFVGYRATVMAGTPVLDVARGLRLRPVERVEAVLNATSNYILSLVEKGLSYDEAVRKAIEYKLAEPDPRVDTHGYDAAAKLAILSCTLGHCISLADVKREPLETVGEEEVRAAPSRGYRVKQVAFADYTRGVYKVAPLKVKAGTPLGRAEGEGNAAVFHLEGSPVSIEGPAGPAWRTARVLVTDAYDYLEWLETVGKQGGTI